MSLDVLILAGGLGTRLRPLTHNVPKSMINVKGKPFINYLINFLSKQSIKNIVISVGYLKEKIMEYLKDGHNFGVDIKYVIEDTPLGTAGAVNNAKGIFKESFLVINGDTLFNIDYKKFFDFHIRKKSLCTMALAYASDASKYGFVKLDDDNKIVEFQEKIKTTDGLINGGAYAFSGDIFDFLPEKGSLEKDVFPSLIGKMYGYPQHGFFVDIGTLETYEEIKNKDLFDFFK